MSLLRNFNLLKVISDAFKDVDVQYPLPTDSDSVYSKDVWVEESITSGWSDVDGVGIDLALIPFTSLHTRIEYSGTTNPKVLFIHFNRTVAAHQIGLGCTGGGDFSNVKIELIGSGGVTRTAVDESASATKYTSRNYPFEPELFNAVRFTFATADDVCLSNITIQKSVNVSSQIQGLRADGTIGTVNVTNGNNLKVSLEEIESSISDDSNSRLMTSTYLIDEFGVTARMHGDNIFQGSPVVIDTAHHEIHCGDSYEATTYISLPNGGVLDVLIKVPNEPGTGQAQKLYHFKSIVESQSEATFELYEGTTVSADGTSIPSFNRNRNSLLTDTLPAYTGPTITTPGTLIYSKIIGSGRTVGGASGRENEIILANNTNYLLRITNNVTTANNVNVELDYYVHPGV